MSRLLALPLPPAPSRIPLAIASIVASAVLASGCGGEDEPRARAAPVAKAGLDQGMPDAELV